MGGKSFLCWTTMRSRNLHMTSLWKNMTMRMRMRIKGHNMMALWESMRMILTMTMTMRLRMPLRVNSSLKSIGMRMGVKSFLCWTSRWSRNHNMMFLWKNMNMRMRMRVKGHNMIALWESMRMT